jgi:phage-related protein
MWTGMLEQMDGSMKIWNGIISGDWGLAWEGIKEIFKGNWDLIVGVLDFAIGWIVDFIVWFSKEIFKLWSNAWDDVWNKIKEILDKVVSFVKVGFTKIKDDVSKIGSGIWSSISETWNGIKETISNIASKLWDSAKGGFDNLKTNIETWVGGLINLFNVGKDWGSHMIDNLVEGITLAWKKGEEKVKGIVKDIKKWLGFSYNKYMPTEIWGKHMVENFAKGVEDSTSIFEDAFGGLQDIVNNGLNMPIMNTAASASSSMAASDSRTARKEASNVVTQNSGNTYNIQPGTMIASQGEIREFVRLLNKYQTAEAARKI